MMRAVFLDRDGVINRRPPEGQYVTRWEEMQILPGVPEAIALLTRAGFRVLTVSNQRCVAKGLLTAAELESIHKRMCQDLAVLGAEITEVYYCPHELEPPCGCRKPAPGMLLKAARAHEIDLSASWMIGDSEIDIEAGRNAGCKTVRIAAGHELPNEAADVLAPSLLEAVHQVMELESLTTPRDGQARKLVR
jgi:D-glycero-D-manno-heptose 1,7-bisphosphate phosphatase